MLLGIVSDTHGYLNQRVLELLRGVEHILHAGDGHVPSSGVRVRHPVDVV